MRDKKGELLSSETVKIVLALIGILLLVYLSTSLYGIFTDKTKIEQSRVNVERIVEIANNLEEGESRNYIIESPKGWHILFFSENAESPESCLRKNCLCFCSEPGVGSCGSNGICRTMEMYVFLIFSESSKFEEVPKEIFIKKSKEGVIITDIEEVEQK